MRSIPLVERQYQVALWIESGTFVGEIRDLVDLTVGPAARRDGYVPPRPEVRGWVDFKTECSSHLFKAASPAAKRERSKRTECT